MDFNEIYHFLFETPVGVGVLILIVIVICIIASVIMEFRTRRLFVDRKNAGKDDWSIFDDDDDEEEETDAK